MKNTIDVINSRKSVRVFENIGISLESKNVIINAAIRAPTAGNQILYTILDIEDQKIKDDLAIYCDNQPFIAKAPMVLVFLADCQKWLDIYDIAKAETRKPQFGDLLLACEDAAIAAENSVLAAESLGIGSCYIGDILENHDKIVNVLKLSKYVLPITMLVFGYPTEQQKNKEMVPRFDKKYVVRNNTYSRLEESEIREMLIGCYGDSSFNVDEFIVRFSKRKYVSDFALELNRSVEKYIEAFE